MKRLMTTNLTTFQPQASLDPEDHQGTQARQAPLALKVKLAVMALTALMALLDHPETF